MIEPHRYHKLTWQGRKTLRERYMVEQEQKCFFCKSNLHEPPPPEVQEKRVNWRLFPKNFLKHPIHLQHSHKTGLTEGAVHALCNAVWWQYHGQ